VLQNVDCDIFTVCETFLEGSQEPKIDGFTWIGNNRGNLHANAHRRSGGVGAFLKDELVSDEHHFIFFSNFLKESSDVTLKHSCLNG
jgi:hypothetical protein